jgi:hypothetical protein
MTIDPRITALSEAIMLLKKKSTELYLAGAPDPIYEVVRRARAHLEEQLTAELIAPPPLDLKLRSIHHAGINRLRAVFDIDGETAAWADIRIVDGEPLVEAGSLPPVMRLPALRLVAADMQNSI